ncbi:hypothetical protein [Pararhizobium sp.]|uniref:hypothetical protein n=1 Tax=Pararhizobium sp. TaxID=1977563 RepID=UPI002D7FFE64|nr:hypothetical protein [Pararhizobium sp.]
MMIRVWQPPQKRKWPQFRTGNVADRRLWTKFRAFFSQKIRNSFWLNAGWHARRLSRYRAVRFAAPAANDPFRRQIQPEYILRKVLEILSNLARQSVDTRTSIVRNCRKPTEK